MADGIQPYRGDYIRPAFSNASVADVMTPGILTCAPETQLATVAEIMQRREGSVRVLVHRGLAKLAVLCQKPVTNEESPAMNEVS